MAYFYASFGLLFILWMPCFTSAQLWNLAHGNKTLDEGKSVRCNSLLGLSRNQKPLCRRYNDHMAFVTSGASIGLQECKYQMRSNRWNCTIPSESPANKALLVGSREVAFSYAITAAGVVHSIARACKNGDLGMECGCSKRRRPDDLKPDWKWGGCGDDTEYAYGFSHEFIDATEKENKPREKRAIARRSMNMHNNEAGRMTVFRLTLPTCKCHGVSGSCSLKTCWMQVPSFRLVGEKLKERYDAAFEMRSTSGGKLKTRTALSAKPSKTDLVFLDSSPDYCRANYEMGVLGTKGRECDPESAGMDGCGLMCCGRGFVSKQVEIVESCNCKFQWCCLVRCQTCRRIYTKHTCN